MAYEVVMSYHLHMPSYFLGTFTEYPFLTFIVADYSSSNRISRIWQAAFATGVPGPKMAATPAL